MRRMAGECRGCGGRKEEERTAASDTANGCAAAQALSTFRPGAVVVSSWPTATHRASTGGGRRGPRVPPTPSSTGRRLMNPSCCGREKRDRTLLLYGGWRTEDATCVDTCLALWPHGLYRSTPANGFDQLIGCR
jgi:hypothetical protein